MTILVLGAQGQLGHALARIGRHRVLALGRSVADLSDPAGCARLLEDLARSRPLSGVINAAAWTAVDAAEDHEAQAHVVNAEAPGALARVAAARGLPFVQPSTDYVFDGRGSRPFAPGDAPAPLNAYGRSKLAGEAAVRAAGGVHAVLRCSWVISARGRNFVTAMLAAAARAEVRVVADQVGGPTPADDLARACLSVVDQLSDMPEKSGTYHYAGAPDVSWAGLAREVFRQANLSVAVHEIASADWPTPAPRPRNSRLDCLRTEQILGLPRPDWRAGLSSILDQMAPLARPGQARAGKDRA
ncbi:dTDP-4-dehydrorhamnose reductase [Pseudooceanicola sp. CBS1P-1]|uniref:dTDP-4-dehydrorhamnose reductase n=1 Tax=Pseudooceanicola albus TaxID=2692189 RepID=A0A6L7GC09_9RHOB|nr:MULTISPECIES: dTDP-4-dehydrorhamnose reductase [Pseudooceanicola]MBT9386727.1 dTDP-4-dehydrorhamnose reductase [Pseudooceanicola endophyticus]MXN20790.1 dTDP-4-dehydrorhamnose reductase [Pseudooceanicola albus]